MTISSSPRVFVSYSHDSSPHKDWVRRLAERLWSNGVDVVLDQWEVGPGDDVTAFMERELSSCNRVLIICTDEYIRKANTLRGGVGYERMIITVEIARQLKTRKFIPVLRDAHGTALPKFLGERIHVDFRAADIEEEQYEVLLRELLRVPKHRKPPLGRSPYGADQATRSQSRRGLPTSRSPKTPANPVNTLQEYKMSTTTEETEEWTFHWHRAVHEYCGYGLYLVLVRFVSGSILFKESIVADLRWAKISDYMIFHLYSDWDLLIRVRADEAMIGDLKKRFFNNTDLRRDQQAEFLTVQELTHFPESSTYADARRVPDLISDMGLAQLREAQEKGPASTRPRSMSWKPSFRRGYRS